MVIVFFSDETTENTTESNTTAAVYANSTAPPGVSGTHVGQHKRSPATTGLVFLLAIGSLLAFAVLVVTAKRCYHGWRRRHYNQVDFLVDGMYTH